MKMSDLTNRTPLKEANGPGTFVGARLTRESERDLMQWMRDNGLRKRQPKARLHITVIGDKKKEFDWTPAKFEPPLEADKTTYKLERLGEDGKAVVLSFSVPELEKRHREGIKKHGITWDHSQYHPHITLSMDPTQLNDIERLLMPTFSLYVKNEYVQPWDFDEENPKSERRRESRTV
jgi:2'-5' RNA ligase